MQTTNIIVVAKKKFQGWLVPVTVCGHQLMDEHEQ